jgi:hypothetical protein
LIVRKEIIPIIRGYPTHCGLLYSGCGPEVSWEIPAVAYSPVYFRP